MIHIFLTIIEYIYKKRQIYHKVLHFILSNMTWFVQAIPFFPFVKDFVKLSNYLLSFYKCQITDCKYIHLLNIFFVL